MRKHLFVSLCLFGVASATLAQQAVVREEMKTMRTYPFSDPNPVATPTNLYYPYFRFDGFKVKGSDQDWKNVVLENDYIKVSMFPEVGGKIWGAIDKTTGKPFVYNNGVAKFRDIAMRGAWVSGGIEFNFGIIGHAPTSSTPVDYLVKKKEDGSVSCYIFSYEWLTRTVWTVEVNLPKDKAYFTTRTSWFNQSGLDQPYYHWMNAGYPVGKQAEFCYPGDHQISHGGEVFTFPTDDRGRKINWYETNNFGDSKSYHVLGYYNDFYGIYWHGEDFGSIHHSAFDEKLGMKIFLWGQSREGGIWEELLTDHDGQYIELQSGRVFNQPASGSSYTPFKSISFAPQATDEWTEYWYPVKGIQGVSKASAFGALHVKRQSGNLVLAFSPLEKTTTEVKVYKGNQLIKTMPLHTQVLQPVELNVGKTDAIPEGQLKVVVGENLLEYSEQPADFDLDRPLTLASDFDWNSAYGLYTQGEQWLNQKVWDKAERYLKMALEKDPCLAPALIRISSLYYREGRYQEAIKHAAKALSLDTYDGEANYYYGLSQRALGKTTEAKAAFSIASFAAQVRTAAYEQLAELYVAEKDWNRAETYAKKSLEANVKNLHARQLLALVYRYTNQKEKAREETDAVLAQWPLYHPARFEKLLSDQGKEGIKLNEFTSLVRNELPAETYLELASWYEGVGCTDEALLLLGCVKNNPLALYQQGYLLANHGQEQQAKDCVKKANALSPDFIFPFRAESMRYLDWASTEMPHWKIDYYRALLYWTNQQQAKSSKLLDGCTEVDYAPFYLVRANFKKGQGRLNDLLQAEKLGDTWRTGFALINYYTETRDWKQVIATGKRYMKKYPQNYYMGLKYASALCEDGQYTACIRFLNQLQVLPNEGAYAGRAVYRAANLFKAMDFYGKRRYAAALKSVEASQEWPENLGVGKPYDENLDQRVEDFIQARICAAEGNQTQATAAYEKVIARKNLTRYFESAQLLIAMSLRDTGHTDQADAMVEAWTAKFPSSQPAQWCKAIYEGDKAKAAAILKNRFGAADATPWETTHNDRDFDLLVGLMDKF